MATRRQTARMNNRQQALLLPRGEATWPDRQARSFAGLRAALWVARGTTGEIPSTLTQHAARDRFDRALFIAEEMGLVRFGYDRDRDIDGVLLTRQGAETLADLGEIRYDADEFESVGPPEQPWSPMYVYASRTQPAKPRAQRHAPSTHMRETPSRARGGPKLPTFAQARAQFVDILRRRGWTTSFNAVKLPHWTSPSGRVRLWLKPQAVWVTEVRRAGDRHEFGHARSTGTDDMRPMSAALMEAWITRWEEQ